MKKLTVIFVISLLALQGFSQEVSESTRKKFSTVLDVFTDIYVNLPNGIETRTINQGMNFSGLYDYRFGKSNFSFAIGVGLGAHNFYSNAFAVTDSNGVSELKRIKTLYPGTDYKKNKISYTYFDIPFEFRLRTKNEFRAAVGFKVGWLIDSHTKYKGENYLEETNDELGVDFQTLKFREVKNIEALRYGVTARVGWKFINLTGFYSLTDIFKKDKGPEVYPISVGISLMPF
jgi:hypothetical protein